MDFMISISTHPDSARFNPGLREPDGLSFDLFRDPAAPWPVGVDDLQEVRRLNPGPGVRGLMSIASHYGLADIDVVGLRPVASLLD